MGGAVDILNYVGNVAGITRHAVAPSWFIFLCGVEIRWLELTFLARLSQLVGRRKGGTQDMRLGLNARNMTCVAWDLDASPHAARRRDHKE